MQEGELYLNELRQIGRVLAGAMLADGFLEADEKESVYAAIVKAGYPTLVPYVEEALESPSFTPDVYADGKALLETLGDRAPKVVLRAFTAVVRVVLADRFASDEECSYLLSLAKVLRVSMEDTKAVFTRAVKELGARLELSGKGVDDYINPRLKELLSFSGADDLVGEPANDSLAALFAQDPEPKFTPEQLQDAAGVLGLGLHSTLADVKDAWAKELTKLGLGALVQKGVSNMTGSLAMAERLHNAYLVLARNAEDSK